VNEYGAFVGDN